MGNYQTSNNQFWVTGDNNTFEAAGGLDSTNAASLDLKAGRTNPGGYLYVVTETDVSGVVKWQNLTPLRGMDGQYVVVLTAAATDAFDKMVNLIEMYRPLLDAGQQMTCYQDWKKQVVIMDGYVGVSAQAAVNNYVKDAVTINLTQLQNLGRMYQNMFGTIAKYDRDIQAALATIPHSTSIGGLTTDMHSLLLLYSKSLKKDNVVYLYPEAAIAVIRKISPTLRNTADDNTAVVETVNIFEPVFNGTGPEQPPLTDQSEIRSIARSDASRAQLSLITSTEPIEAKALKSGTPSKTYNLRLLDAVTTPWVSKASALTKITRITVQDSAKKSWYTVVSKDTTALHLDDITSMAITLDIGGESYYYKKADKEVDPKKATLAFLYFTSTKPLEEIAVATDIQSAKIVATEKLTSATSSIAGASIVSNTALHYNFSHKMLRSDRTEVNHYLLAQLLFETLDQDTDYPQPDAWAGRTTLQSLDSDKVTVKGVEVDRVIPATAFGNYTPAEQKSALPNDLHNVMSVHLERAAKALTAIDDEDTEGVSTISNSVYGALIAAQSPAPGPMPWKNIKFEELREQANKAVSSFKRDPSQALVAHDPVLGDSTVMTSLLNGVGSAVKTKGLSTASKDSRSMLTAAQSGQELKQKILDKMAALFPAGDRPKRRK
nr:outer shell [Largemouth bass reovirus]